KVSTAVAELASPSANCDLLQLPAPHISFIRRSQIRIDCSGYSGIGSCLEAVHASDFDWFGLYKVEEDFGVNWVVVGGGLTRMSHERNKKTTTKESDCGAETLHEGEGLMVEIAGQRMRSCAGEGVSVRMETGEENDWRARGGSGSLPSFC
ncbi:hypothetical protein Droror1_Dr00027058, partial [Drosera rotundifolia]